MDEKKQKTNIVLIIGNLVSIVAVFIVNALASLGILNGTDTGELSDALPNLFVPAGITFAIWGIIYLFFINFAVFNIYTLVTKNEEGMEVISRIGIWFIISSVGNFVWIFLWHWQIVWLSLIFMLMILVPLMIIYIKLKIGIESGSWKRWILVHWTISLYMGWITVATIANVTAVFVDLNLVTTLTSFGISAETWTVVVIGAAGIISILNVFTRKDIPYNLVILWALLGIILKRLNPTPTDPAFPNVLTTIIYAAGLTMTYIVLSLGIKWVKVLTKR